MTTINTLEKLAAWLLFSLAVLMIYSYLSVAWAGDGGFKQVPGADGCPQEDCRGNEVYLIATPSASMHVWVWSSYMSYATLGECKKIALPFQKCVAMQGNMPPNAVSDRP